jgi:hypothetical protein
VAVLDGRVEVGHFAAPNGVEEVAEMVAAAPEGLDRFAVVV